MGNKPTIGIVGGSGPLACLDIEAKIFKAMQSTLRPIFDQDYFNLIVHQHTQFQDRFEVGTDSVELYSQYLKCVNALISIGADVLLIACNSAHRYIKKLQQDVKAPIINIVQETVHYIAQITNKTDKIGLLASSAAIKSKLYLQELKAYGYEIMILNDDLQQELMQAIYIIKAGYIGRDQCFQNRAVVQVTKPNNTNNSNLLPWKQVLLRETIPGILPIMEKTIRYLESHGCKHIILGCTELPKMLPYLEEMEKSISLIDVNKIAAQAVVARACVWQNKTQ